MASNPICIFRLADFKGKLDDIFVEVVLASAKSLSMNGNPSRGNPNLYHGCDATSLLNFSFMYLRFKHVYFIITYEM